MKTTRIAAVLFALTLFAAAETYRMKSICKVSHVGPNLVGVSCLNGGDPTVVTGVDSPGMLIVSCGK